MSCPTPTTSPPRAPVTIPGLTTKVLTSLVWVFTNIAARNGIQFLRMWVLWKILTARDFGLNSMAWIAIGAATLIQDMGFNDALVQRKKDLDLATSVAWYANVTIRLVMFAVLFVISPLVAAAFREPEVAPILRWASVSIVIGSFGSVNEALLRREFRFKQLLIVDSAEILVLTLVQVITAWYGAGVWSLVYGTIAGSAVRSLSLWWLAPIKVGRFDMVVAKEMFHFGKHMTLSSLGLYLIKNLDYYFVGRYLGAPALGLYALAFKLSDLIAVNVVRQLGSVLFPAFAAIGHDQDRVRAAWVRAVRYSMVLVMPMGVFIIVLAPEIVKAFFPRGGTVVALPLSILTVFAICRAIGSPLGDLAKGIGKPRILTQVVICHVVVMAPLLYLVTAHGQLGTRAGLVAVSLVVSCTAVFAITLSLRLTGREVNLKARHVVEAMAPALLAGAAMAAAGWGTKLLLRISVPGGQLPPIGAMFTAGLAAVAVYGWVLRLVFPTVPRHLHDAIRRRRLEKGGTAQTGAVPG